MIRAIIIDIGGVIQGLDWSPVVNSLLDVRDDLSIECYKEAFYRDRKEWFNKYQTGKMDRERFWREVARRLSIPDSQWRKLSESFGLLYSFVDSEIVGYLRRLKGSYKLYALANTIPELEDKIIADLNYNGLFERIFFSHAIGTRKPSEEAYLYVLKKINQTAEECIFIDNDKRNVTAAKGVGMSVVLYRGFSVLKKELLDRFSINQGGISEKRIGYTTGVFDLFHVGHLNLLRRARSYCDYLIVGVTTDALSEKFKGKLPIVPLKERMEILSALSCVDLVVPQENMDKFSAWEKYKFDVMFASENPTVKWPKVEADFRKRFIDKGITCPDIINLPYTKGVSSTSRREVLKKAGK